MSGQDLFLEIRDKDNLLHSALSELGKRGKAYADAERNYRIALAKKMLVEREKGTPVTILSDICRGDEEIAELKFKRDVADVLYKSSLEAINIYKLDIKVLESAIEREWGNA